jgi:hypothetical protein
LEARLWVLAGAKKLGCIMPGEWAFLSGGVGLQFDVLVKLLLNEWNEAKLLLRFKKYKQIQTELWELTRGAWHSRGIWQRRLLLCWVW